MKVIKASLSALFFLLFFLPLQVSAQNGNLIIVVDSSGSMWGRLDGYIKMDLAKSSLNEALQNIQAEPNIGLMAFGHRRKKDCSDIEFMEPLSKIDKDSLKGKVSTLTPNGKTPLETAIRMAVEEVQIHREKATILIISDGKDTCGGDPCAIAKKLKAESETDFVIDVIGLVSQMDGTSKTMSEESYSQLKCITDATGGKYYSVNNASDFRLAIAESIAQETVVEPEPEPTPPVGFVTDETGWVNLLDDSEPSRDIIDAVTVIKAGFVDVKENISKVGHITGVETRSSNIYQNDKVTIKLDVPAKVGDKLLAYEVFKADSLKKIIQYDVFFADDIDDSEGNYMGQLYDINGILEITKEIGGGKYYAKMVQYFDNTQVGNALMLMDTELVNPPQTYPYMQRPDRNFPGAEVIAAYKLKRFSGKGDIVYINKGKNQKVLVGDNFEVYPNEEFRAEGSTIYPDVFKIVKDLVIRNELPKMERAGIVTIVGLRKDTAIGYIIESDRKIISAGYRLELIQD